MSRHSKAATQRPRPSGYAGYAVLAAAVLAIACWQLTVSDRDAITEPEASAAAINAHTPATHDRLSSTDPSSNPQHAADRDTDVLPASSSPEAATAALFNYHNHGQHQASDPIFIEQGQAIGLQLQQLKTLRVGDPLQLPIAGSNSLRVSRFQDLGDGQYSLSLSDQHGSETALMISGDQLIGIIVIDEQTYAIESTGDSGWIVDATLL